MEEKVRNHRGDAETKKMRRCSSRAENTLQAYFLKEPYPMKDPRCKRFFPEGCHWWRLLALELGKSMRRKEQQR